MAQERPWRPTDYCQQTVYVPPQAKETTRAFEAPGDRGSAEHVRAPREPERKDRTLAAWNIVAWALPCGFVVGVVIMVVALLVLHLA
jgi:hypothetical protein